MPARGIRRSYDASPRSARARTGGKLLAQCLRKVETSLNCCRKTNEFEIRFFHRGAIERREVGGRGASSEHQTSHPSNALQVLAFSSSSSCSRLASLFGRVPSGSTSCLLFLTN